VLAAAGAVDHDRLVALAGEAFASLPAAGEMRAAAPGLYAGGELVRTLKTDQSHLVIGLSGKPFLKGEHYPLQVLATALGGGMSSRLFQEVREERGLAYAIDAFHWAFSDTGVFGIGAGASPKDVPQLIEVALGCLKDAAAGLTEAEAARARAQMKVGLLSVLESPGGRVEQIARQVLTFGRIIPGREIAARIDAVSVDALRAAAAELASAPATVAMVGPKVAKWRTAVASLHLAPSGPPDAQ
jgi:predicted Zn-dependent peptidase